jgi:multicomponent Na+:H+ antiporter subunit B
MTLRAGLGAIAVVVLGGAVMGGLLGLPHPGGAPAAYGDLAAQLSSPNRHISNAVAGVVFDIRGFDTLIEELVLFASAAGATLLLRTGATGEDEEDAEREDEARGAVEPLRPLGALLVGPLVLFGIYIVAHGHLSPGGGFQGGVLLAGALLLVHAAGQLMAVEELRPVALVEVAEATGALAYALVGIGGIVFATVAFQDFLGSGISGTLLSGGTIPVLQVAVGVEVAGAITLILTELFNQLLAGEDA